MLIENPEAFKAWMTTVLEPLCDADPEALAKYIYALVKKDKPMEELRRNTIAQLEVFLNRETKSFVDLMFTKLEVGFDDDPTPVVKIKEEPVENERADIAEASCTPGASFGPRYNLHPVPYELASETVS